MFRNLIHVTRDDARTHRFPQRLYVLAVPRIALLRHRTRTDLRRTEILEYFSDLRTLEIAQIVGEVCDDAEGGIAFEQQA